MDAALAPPLAWSLAVLLTWFWRPVVTVRLARARRRKRRRKQPGK